MRSRASCFTVVVASLAACGTPVKPASSPAAAAIPTAAPPDAAPHHLAELETPDARRLLAIDWRTVHPATDADALAIWQQIAPTGADWSDKLAEIPADLALAHALAVAFLRAGNFTCTSPAHHCPGVPVDVPAPEAAATLGDPCLRRLLALWSLAQLEPADVPAMRDTLVAIASIPPPESELVAAALAVVPEDDQATRMAVLTAAWNAGQHEVVSTSLGDLDEAHLIELATKLHVDAALAILSAEADRAVYLAAIDDEQLARAARIYAITDVTGTEDPLHADSKAALVTAARGKDCVVAATAARILEQTGDHRFVPVRPHTHSPVLLMHAVCVMAAYASLQRADQASPLASYLPARGLEIRTTSDDPLSDPRAAGDHRIQTTDLVPRGEAMFPELDDFVRASDHCVDTGLVTTCSSDSRTFTLTFAPSGGDLVLSRIELTDRPTCSELASP